MKAIDLANLDTVKGANEGFSVPIYHPGTNEELGIKITVLGQDSDEFVKLSRAQIKKRRDKLIKSGFRADIPVDEIERDDTKLLAAMTKSWEGVIIDGKPIDCNMDNVIMVYERWPWLREQVDKAIGDRANFIKG